MLETVLSIMYYYFTICKDCHGENILVGCFSWTYIVIGIMLLLFLWSSVKGRLGLKEDFPLSWSFKLQKNYFHYVMLSDNQVGFWQL